MGVAKNNVNVNYNGLGYQIYNFISLYKMKGGITVG